MYGVESTHQPHFDLLLMFLFYFFYFVKLGIFLTIRHHTEGKIAKTNQFLRAISWFLADLLTVRNVLSILEPPG